MGRPGRDQLVSRAIDEAVGAIAAPSVRDQVIDLALRWARLSEVPERGAAVGAFVRNSLFLAVKHSLGEEAAHTVCDELNNVVSLVADDEISSVRPSRPPTLPAHGSAPLPRGTVSSRGDDLDDDLDEPELTVEVEEIELEEDDIFALPSKPPCTPTSPAPKPDLPRVLVASTDPTSVSHLSRALRAAACLEPASDALAVLDGLGRHEATIVVLDCQRPSVQLETFVAMHPEIPEGCHVVLWGEPPGLERRLASLGKGIPNSWIRCGPGAQADEVAVVCRVLLEPAS